MGNFTHAGALRPGTGAAARGLPLTAVLLAVAACSDLPVTTAPDELVPSMALVGTAFDDNFGAFDDSRWSLSTHTLGRGPLDPANVVIQGDSVRLETLSSSFEGAEIRTWNEYGSGTFTTRARCAVPAGAICAFFLYQTGVGDRADEIDIEIRGSSRTVWFTTWVRGRRTNSREATLRFDPALGMHTYTIVRDAAEILFVVDGETLARFKGKAKLPQATMPLFANAWWPTWLPTGTGNGAWVIDYIAAY